MADNFDNLTPHERARLGVENPQQDRFQRAVDDFVAQQGGLKPVHFAKVGPDGTYQSIEGYLSNSRHNEQLLERARSAAAKTVYDGVAAPTSGSHGSRRMLTVNAADITRDAMFGRAPMAETEFRARRLVDIAADIRPAVLAATPVAAPLTPQAASATGISMQDVQRHFEGVAGEAHTPDSGFRMASGIQGWREGIAERNPQDPSSVDRHFYAVPVAGLHVIEIARLIHRLGVAGKHDCALVKSTSEAGGPLRLRIYADKLETLDRVIADQTPASTAGPTGSQATTQRRQLPQVSSAPGFNGLR